MRKWRPIDIKVTDNGNYLVVYLMDEKEKLYAIVKPALGLEKAITDVGVMLASLPPRRNATIGGH